MVLQFSKCTLFLMLVVVVIVPRIDGFGVVVSWRNLSSRRIYHQQQEEPQQPSVPYYTTTTLSLSDVYEEVEEEAVQSDHSLVDENGKEITVGNIVRIAMKDIKAYQVPKSARGSFNVLKEFVMDESLPFLILPVGLRGEVVRVYNIHEVSANFPISVRFQNDKHTEEGYRAPSTFIMHFRHDEIECI